MDSASERIQTLCSHLTADQQEECEEDEQLLANEVSEEASSSSSQSLITTGYSSSATGKDTVTVIDNRTGKSVEIPIYRETIQATELGKLGLRSFDPGYLNTSSARSKICYIDGDKGELWYRGYPIEILAERSTFLEVAYLLIYGELPVRSQLEDWETLVMSHTFIHTNLVQLLSNFRYDSHPMGIVISAMAALGTFYPECNPALAGNDVFTNPEIRNKQIVRIMGKLPTIAACAYRHRIGRSYNEPMPGLSYTENFLCMLDRLQDKEYRPHPRLAHALDVLFILHADHELNCSTSAMRHITSANTDPYTAVAGSAAALYGPLHGGANEAVLRMLESIGSIENVPAFIEQVKQRKKKLMGFGHRVYKSYDPRAKIIRQIAYEVFSILGDEPLILVALELEKIALNDEYFIKRKLYPNVDFYSGLIYRAMGFPTDMFPVLFAIPRAVGWLAHWNEQLDDSDTKIYRPRQIYEGSPIRDYIPISQREKLTGPVKIYTSNFSKRRSVAPRK